MIADGLTAEGIPTPNGKAQWSTHTIDCILRNEKYVGDLWLQKTFKADLLADRQVNNGERDKFEIKDHHIPIVDRQLWNCVQAELAKRKSIRETKAGKSSKVSRAYAFSNKLVCGDCNSILARAYWRSKNNKYYIWSCSTERKFNTCGTKPIYERKVEDAFLRVMAKLAGDKEGLLETLNANVQMILSQNQRRTKADVLADISARQNEILNLAKVYEKNAEDFKRGDALCQEIDKLRQELVMVQQAEQRQYILADAVGEITSVLAMTFEKFDEQAFTKAIDRVIVHPKQRHAENATTKITFILKCGIEMVERI